MAQTLAPTFSEMPYSWQFQFATIRNRPKHE